MAADSVVKLLSTVAPHSEGLPENRPGRDLLAARGGFDLPYQSVYGEPGLARSRLLITLFTYLGVVTMGKSRRLDERKPPTSRRKSPATFCLQIG